MPMKTGTFDVGALLAATATPIGSDGFTEQAIAATLAADNAAFSQIVDEMLGDLAETSTDRIRPVGSSIGGTAMEVDEMGQGPTQRDIPGYFLGFPLKRIQFPVGWTTQWLKNASVADVAIRNSAAQGAHLRRARYEVQKAIFTPTNYTFIDHLVDKASISVKAFLNADSAAIANGPNGETFDGASHTHYDGVASLTAAALTALIQDVVEHRNGARVRVNVNVADAGTVSAVTGFVPLQVPYVTLNSAANQATDRLDITKADNRQIGWFGVAEVWTKPWVPAFYAVAVDVDAPQKPLVKRVERSDRGIHIAAEIESHPLHASFSEWFYGFGSFNRSALAVLKFNNASYSAPSLSY